MGRSRFERWGGRASQGGRTGPAKGSAAVILRAPDDTRKGIRMQDLGLLDFTLKVGLENEYFPLRPSSPGPFGPGILASIVRQGHGPRRWARGRSTRSDAI